MYKELKEVVPIYLITRILILISIVSSYCIELTPVAAKGDKGINYSSEIIVDKTKIAKALRNVFSSADAGWYADIAENGYHTGLLDVETPKNWVFFPLMPLLISLLNYFTNNSLISGLIISNLCFIFSLALFSKLAKKYELTKEQLSFAILLICVFPTSYFFSAALTESLFLFLSLCSFYFLSQDKIISSSIFFALLSATRPTGLLVFPAYFLELIRKRSVRSSLAAIISLSGLVVYMFYLKKHVGDFFAFSKNQQAWGRNKDTILDLISNIAHNPGHLMQSWDFLLLNLLSAILGIIICFFLLRKKQYNLSLFLFLPLAVSLYTGRLLSLTRFVMALFPLYIGMALLIKNPRHQNITLIVFSFLLGIMSAMFGALITAAMA